MNLYNKSEELLENISMRIIKNALKSKLDPYNLSATNHFYDRAGERDLQNRELIDLFNTLLSRKYKEKLKNIKTDDIIVSKNKINVPIQRMKGNKLKLKTIFRDSDENVPYKTKKRGQYQLNLMEKIKHIDGKWVVYGKKGGKRLGTHNTKEDAIKQLSAIEISKKNKRKSMVKESFNKVLENKTIKERVVILEKLLGYLKK